MQVRPALCLDWDGTVRRSKSGASFIKNFQDIELMPGVEKLIMAYRKLGFLIIGISNQGGVAHGYKTTMEIELERDTTFNLFAENPFHIVKMCYHMEDGKIEPFCHRSLLRKPDIGMLAIAEYDAFANGFIIDWDKSLFVGDRPEDKQCAENARIKYMDINDFLVTPISNTVVTMTMGRVADMVQNLVGELTPSKVKILLEAVSQVPGQENISGVYAEGSTLIGNAVGRVFEWQEFLNLYVKIGNINFSS